VGDLRLRQQPLWDQRVRLVKLVPAEKIGEFFGLFAVGQRFGAVIGPLIWGLTISALAERGAIAYRAATVALMLTLTLGFFLMMRVKEPKPGAEPEVTYPLEASSG
jgi:MFS-type transporter involved in bile tolerance (Atg22 family)